MTLVIVAAGILAPARAFGRTDAVNRPGLPSDGSFVSYLGYVYRIAGGAPLYVSSWASFGGPQPTTALTAAQFAALNSVPTSGTLIRDNTTGAVYEVAGGAPLYVSSFAAIGGPRATVGIDPWDIANISDPLAHLNAVPADGTFIGDTATGMVYETAGGAPLYVNSWAAVGGSHPTTNVDDWDLTNITNPAAHLNSVPADGTFISDTASGMVFEVAGGAPLYVNSWSAVGGAHPTTGVPDWDFANISNPAAHMSAVPADGTFISDTANGMVFEVAGGAPLYVSTWSAVGGAHPTTGVPDWDFANITNPAAHMNAFPTDGTFIGTSAGAIYRIAGGAPFAVTNWAHIGGPQPYVTVDQWDVSNRANPAAHLAVAPADGTIVRGLPSGSYWNFKRGYRYSTPASGQAVPVDDNGLAAYIPVPVPTCTNLSLATPANGGGLSGAMSCSSVAGMGLAYQVVSAPAHGTLLAVNSVTGSFVYDSDAGYTGTDSFTYRATNLGGPSSIATATIKVPPLPPACSNLFTSVSEDSGPTAVQLSCVAPPGIPMSFSIVKAPSHGALSALSTTTGALQYTPHAGYHGSDTFTYQATDAGGTSSIAAATIAVTPSTVVVRRHAVLEPFVSSTLLYYPTYTVFDALAVDDLTGPVRVRVSCAGKGCPFRSRTVNAPAAKRCKPGHAGCRGHGKPSSGVNLVHLIRGRHLGVGIRLTIAILEPGVVSKTYVFTVRRDHYPLIQMHCAGSGGTVVPPSC